MYVYMLKCADETYYTGVTNNLENRLQQHKSGIHKEAIIKGEYHLLPGLSKKN